jgi:hypothetical protein
VPIEKDRLQLVYTPKKAQIMTSREAKNAAAEIKAFIRQLPPKKIKALVVKAGI